MYQIKFTKLRYSLFFFLVIFLPKIAIGQTPNVIEHNLQTKKEIIYISPGWAGSLFEVDDPRINRDDCVAHTYQLRKFAAEEGYEIRQADSLQSLEDFKYLIIFEVFPTQIEQIKQYPKEKLILFLWEPPSTLAQNYDPKYHEYFSKVYTWNDDLVDNKKYFKFYHPALRPMISEQINFEEKKLCTLIACNKWSPHPNELYGQRLSVINFFEDNHPSDFDLYGKWWSNSLKVYKGEILKKVDYLKLYKFCFAYENVKEVPGYVTEKIFDCFSASSVPIYSGAPNITRYIPKECFIARENFENNEQLYLFLKNMPKEQYQEYILNIKTFLKSQEAEKYSINHFVKTVLDFIKESPDQEKQEH